MACREREADRTAELEDALLDQLAAIPHTCVNGGTQRVAGIVNVRFAFVANESLMIALRDEIRDLVWLGMHVDAR